MIQAQNQSSTFLNRGVKVVEEFHSLSLLDDLYDVLLNLYIPPSTYFIEQRLLFEDSCFYKEMEAHMPKAMAMFVSVHLKKLSAELGIDEESCGGWEIWARITTKNSPSFGYLHVDNDELLRYTHGIIKFPLYGSILYVSPADKMGGGETVFLEEQKDDFTEKMFRVLNFTDFVSPPFVFISSIPGRLVIFPGNIPHAVMWTNKDKLEPRVTFLANYWPTRISSVPVGVCMFDTTH